MTLRILILLCCAMLATAEAQTIAITGARVHTVAEAGTIDDATILVMDGRIAAVGRNVAVPADARRIDAEGQVVTPGLFTPIGQIGLTEVSAVAGTVDYIQRGDAFSASFDIADAYNPRSTLIPVNRIEGITHAAIAPAASAPNELGLTSRVMSGLGAVVLLGDVDPVVRPAAMLVVSLGESGGAVAGGSRAAALLTFRAALEDALDYAGHRDEYQSRDRRDYSVSMADLEALQDVIEGTTPVLVHVDRASDIRQVLSLADEFKLDLIIAGGAEAWMVADELAAADVGVIIAATGNLPDNFDSLNARLDAAAILEAAGVTVAFGGDRNSSNHNARNITQVAGIAVANGMTWESALRAITLTPAELYGVADQTGSIEAGKDADLVIWNDDPLELQSYPHAVYIKGQAIPMQSRQTLLRDRYLNGNANVPPAFRR